METSKSELLKSVVIRFKKRRNKLLIPKSELDFLEVFLKKNISDDIVVINTNIGLGIYYAAEKDHSEIIKHSILSHTKEDSKHLIFLKDHSFESLKINFTKAFYTFAKYPRLFFSYVKKFIYLRKKYAESKVVMPSLNKLYLKALNHLNDQGNLPFVNKIIALDHHFIQSNSNSILAELAAKMNAKEHLN